MIRAKTPIAVFVYKRPQHTQVMFESLSRSGRLDECRIHVFCDGPKRPEDARDVEAARSVARSWATRLDAQVREEKANKGLAGSIVSGVSELCEDFGRVIVIEDDFVLSPSFVHFMLEGLDAFQENRAVFQISGYMFPIDLPPGPEGIFLPFTTTWGWATWKRAWQYFDPEADDADLLLKNRETRRRFNLDNSYPYADMLRQRLDGHNDSWGILWWWSVFKRDGLVLHPRKSLVMVGGFDETGTHCKAPSEFQHESEEQLLTLEDDRPFIFPTEVAVDAESFGRIKSFVGSSHRPERSNLRSKIARRLARAFARRS